MIRYIQEQFEVGSQITVYYNKLEVSGTIERLEDDVIFIQLEEGNVMAIKGEAIEGFSKDPITPMVEPAYGDSSSNDRGVNINSNQQWKEPTDYAQPRYSEPYMSESELQQEVEIYQEIAVIKEQILDELGLLLEEHSAELDQLVPARGTIVELKHAFQFGFIDDLEDGVRYFFNRNEIIDGSLKSSEGSMIPVVYQRTRNHKGPAAKMIFLSGTVEETLHLFQSFLDSGQYGYAKYVLECIQEVTPSEGHLFRINELLDQVLDKSQSIGGEIKKGRNSLYSEARKRLQNKDYESALEIYQKCLNLGIRRENCIKDILQIYVTTFAQKQSELERAEVKQLALDFIEQYQDELPDEPSTNFTLENAYFALCEYEKHAEIAEEIVAECGRKGELPQYVFYLNKLGQSYYRLGELDKALDAVNQGLDIEPQNLHLIKTRNTIVLAQRGEEYLL